jgi:hypothetical protein
MDAGAMARWFGALSLVAYVVVGQRFGEQFPFSPLRMFAENRAATVGRIVVRKQDGGLAEVDDFDAWACAGPLAFVSPASPCAEGLHRERDQKAADYIAAHAGAPSARGEQVVVVRRVFAFDRPGGPVQERTCELVACTAVPR